MLSGKATQPFSLLPTFSVEINYLKEFFLCEQIFFTLTLLHSKGPKRNGVLDLLSAIGLRVDPIFEGLFLCREANGKSQRLFLSVKKGE